jgi:hypothetical protein
MRKVLIVLLVSMLATFSTNLHSESFGLKFGVNFTNWVVTDCKAWTTEWVDSTYLTKSKKKLGFTMGAFYTFDVSKKIQIQPEIYYTRINLSSDWNPDWFAEAGMSVSAFGELVDYWRLDVIRVPVLAKYKISDFQIFAGPYLSYLLNAREFYFNVILDIYGDIDLTKISDENPYGYNRLNYGLVFGIELEKDSFLAGIRYGFDLSNNAKKADPTLTDGVYSGGANYRMKYNSISVLFGWKF